MNDNDVSHKLQSHQDTNNLIRSLINFGLADLSNQEGSLSEEHHINLYKTVLDLLERQNKVIEDLLIELKKSL